MAQRLCKFCTRGVPAQRFRYHTERMCEQCAIDRGILIPCTGEAHQVGGGYIDHCAVCMPRWGWKERIPMEVKVELLKVRPANAIFPVQLGVRLYLNASLRPYIEVNFMAVDRDTGLLLVRAEGEVICNFAFPELTAKEAETLAEALLMASFFARCLTPIAEQRAQAVLMSNWSVEAKSVHSELLAELKVARIVTGQESEDE